MARSGHGARRASAVTVRAFRAVAWGAPDAFSGGGGTLVGLMVLGLGQKPGGHPGDGLEIGRTYAVPARTQDNDGTRVTSSALRCRSTGTRGPRASAATSTGRSPSASSRPTSSATRPGADQLRDQLRPTADVRITARLHLGGRVPYRDYPIDVTVRGLRANRAAGQRRRRRQQSAPWVGSTPLDGCLLARLAAVGYRGRGGDTVARARGVSLTPLSDHAAVGPGRPCR
jgi:hypothetical protein